MSRTVCLGFLVLAFVGCQLPPERPPPQLLPENSGPVPFAELLTRARQQATAATEAFYVNRWDDLEGAARGLEQTARFLPKASEVPANHKNQLGVEAGELEKAAAKLREAAKIQDAKLATEIMQRINLKVRELRPEG